MDFYNALEQKTLLRELLRNDDFERQYRIALRTKDARLVLYFRQKEVLEDMVDSLIDEEGRTLQDASEVLGIMLSNLDDVTDAFVQDHLEHLFSYLRRSVMNPRRLYYFLRVTSFLFTNRTQELFSHVTVMADFAALLISNLSSPHIMQLLLHIIKLEEQLRLEGSPHGDWSQKCNLVQHLVKVLKSHPHQHLESVTKLMTEVFTTTGGVTSPFLKSILVAENGALFKVLVQLTRVPALSVDAFRSLDEVLLKIITANDDDVSFFSSMQQILKEEYNIFLEMSRSNSLRDALASVRFFNILVKHKAFSLFEENLVETLQLFPQYPHSNILHNVVCSMICQILQTEDKLTEQLISGGIVEKIISELASPLPNVGYRSHLKLIAHALFQSPSRAVKQYLHDSRLWAAFLRAKDFWERKDLTFRGADRLVAKSLREALDLEGGGGNGDGGQDKGKGDISGDGDDDANISGDADGDVDGGGSMLASEDNTAMMTSLQRGLDELRIDEKAQNEGNGGGDVSGVDEGADVASGSDISGGDEGGTDVGSTRDVSGDVAGGTDVACGDQKYVCLDEDEDEFYEYEYEDDLEAGPRGKNRIQKTC
eukprot:TRINITY_DN2962_c0_g5_i18.p1 TRINITY_DN2962_c0_g5~~TRINITY_DN2962_c0_g5_i18.p1  ORF type:complete len:596 (-),score=149.99 TRINITY_DN2962_c0_g5_i18:175-1962(-)